MESETLTSWGAFSALDKPAGMLVGIEFPVLFSTGTGTRDTRRVGDGPRRMLADGGFTAPSELPVPISLQRVQAPGHDGAIVVGRIDRIEQIDASSFRGYGWLIDDEYGAMAARLVQTKVLRGASPDLIDVEYESTEDGGVVFRTFSINGSTLVASPAMADTDARLLSEITLGEPIPDFEVAASVELALPKMTQAVDQIVVPAASFRRHDTDKAYPITVDTDGHVHGYLAQWGVCHIGHTNRCVTAKPSPTNYAHFASKAVLTDEGFVNTGPIFLGGPHAPLGLSVQDRSDFYASTSAAWADVAIGDDDHGIWLAGMVRPGTTAEQIYAARASTLSGHWAPVQGHTDLVAVLSVNSGGYEVPRVFGVDDTITELVAVGVLPIPDQPDDLQTTVERLAVAVERLAADPTGAYAAELRSHAAEADTWRQSIKAAETDCGCGHEGIDEQSMGVELQSLAHNVRAHTRAGKVIPAYAREDPVPAAAS